MGSVFMLGWLSLNADLIQSFNKIKEGGVILLDDVLQTRLLHT